MTARQRLRPADLLWAWAAALVGFLVGEYGSGVVLAARAGAAGTDAVLALLWLPWLAAPVLAGLLGAWALPVARVTARWQWLLGTVAIPLGAAAVTTAVVVVTGSTAAGLLLSIVVQVVVTAAVALGVGAWRSARLARSPGAPLTYTTPHPEDQLA
ncbi:hypothetical protein HP550_12995 [Cellulomonas humilata]|uniref:Uncharacterized protein n=1 Tax=Cellulomonas humilata TaxID=144055 RepID=A0A7Y6A1T2_9CELL|nr:hypothetical protein [Cellulomonas humilata]NUU18166.1 hypothetical protein [Cellulomonas humilata]